MDDSDSSSLSSAPEEEVQKLAPIFIKAKKATKAVAPPPKASPPRPKREPSPPHEEVLADNADIAFIVMFRSRFQHAFPPKLAHLGPQDIERGVTGVTPSPQVEALLCALLGLVLNRKKPVEQGHHGRALEEAVQSHKSQWPLRWQGVNPLHGPRDFNTMPTEERLSFLRTLIMWATVSSETISASIKDNYKQSRHNDDENQPLSVQPWGRDGDKRRYFLIEGQDDTSFRVYREGHRYNKHPTWWNMAGDIEEIRKLAEKLEKEDGSQAARTLSQRMLNAIPRFEATEEKRRRREYRQTRRAAFTRPEPGFSLYEGRTRGKRMRYTYDDDDAFDSDDTSNRRSARQSERSTPFESGPITTLSGRQVKPRRGGEYGASLLSGQVTGGADELALDHDDQLDATDDGEPVRSNGRSTRTAGRTAGHEFGNPKKHKLADDYNSLDDLSEEEDAAPSGDEWDSEANGHEDHDMPDADDEDDPSDEVGDDDQASELKTLVVKLKVSPKASNKVQEPLDVPSIHAFPGFTGNDVSNGLTSQQDHKDAIPTCKSVQSMADDDTSSHQRPPPAQVPLSGYPTPSSLPQNVQKLESGATSSTSLSHSLASITATDTALDQERHLPPNQASIAAIAKVE